MHLVSIQVAEPQPVPGRAETSTTGIFKQPVPTATLTVDGLVGDTVANQKHHGGPDQSVYVYSRDDYDWWEAELGRSLAGGAFGENLTIDTAGPEPVRIGDRFEIGSRGAVVEVSAPRIPCNVFAARMGRSDWIEQFRSARRPGFYCRVVGEAAIETGDVVTRYPAQSSNLELLDMYDRFFERSTSAEWLSDALRSPVAIRARVDYERQLEAKRSAAG